MTEECFLEIDRKREAVFQRVIEQRNALAGRLRAVEAQDGVSLIAAERARQISREGWTPEHDDEHRNGEMAISAVRSESNKQRRRTR